MDPNKKARHKRLKIEGVLLNKEVRGSVGRWAGSCRGLGGHGRILERRDKVRFLVRDVGQILVYVGLLKLRSGMSWG